MKCCPQCGAGRNGETDHRVHKRTRKDTDIRTDGGQGPPDGRGGDQNGQPPQGGRGQQPKQGGRRGQPRGQQRRNPPAGAPDQGDDGVDRRTLLLGGGGVLAVLGGGWFFFLRDDGNPTDSPDSVAKAYTQALTSGDAERAKELAHADSPAQIQVDAADTSFFQSIEEQDVDVSVDATTVDEDPGNNADNYDPVEEFQSVEVSISLQGDEDTLPGVTAQNTDGEWKMWSLDLL